MNRVVGGKINKSKKLYGGSLNNFLNYIEQFLQNGTYDLKYDSYDIAEDYPHDLIFKFGKIDFENIIRLLVEGKSLEDITTDDLLDDKQLTTNAYNLSVDENPELEREDYLLDFVRVAVYLVYVYNSNAPENSKIVVPDFRDKANEGLDVINMYIQELTGDIDVPEQEEEEEALDEDPASRMTSRRSSRVSLASNPTSRRPSIASIIQSRPASRRPSRVIPDTDPEGVSESIYGPDDPRPVGYGKNKNKKSSLYKNKMESRIVGAGKKMSAMEKKLMGMGMSGGQIKKLMKLGMLEKGKGMSGGKKMKKIEEEDEEMSESESDMEEEKPMKGGRVAIDPFFGVISSEGGAMNFAHPESFADRRPMSKLAFGKGISDKHDKQAIMEDKALEMKEAVRRAGTENRRELDRKMAGPRVSGGAKAEMEGGFWGSLLSAAVPLIGSLFGRGMMTKEAHDELMKHMKQKEKKGGAKKMYGQTRKDKEDEKLGMEMEDVKKKLGEGMSGGRKGNSFIQFANAHREKVRAQMKGAPMKEVMKKLGEMYRAQKK